MTVEDLNAAFRGDVYGDRPAMDAPGFRAHVERNGVDLARSRRWNVDGRLSGVALLAFRGERAWIGGFGVVPEFRGRGLAQRYLDETVALARAAGATSVELEVLERNVRAVRLYERAGFATIDEVVVWMRGPLRAPREREAVPQTRAFEAAEIAALARTPPSCWQREPDSVAAASPLEPLFVGTDTVPEAYALVRRGERATVVDARAHAAAPAAVLLAKFDAQVPADDLALVNEPARGALHDAFTAHPGWHEFGRQYRMRLDSR